MLIFLSQPWLASKVSRVKPEPQILQDIPAGCFKHCRSLEKSCLNLEFCREILMSFYALASLRHQKPSLTQTPPFWHFNRKIQKEKCKNNFTMCPGGTSRFLEAVKYFSKTKNESRLLGTSPASRLAELNRQQETLQTRGRLSSKTQRMTLPTRETSHHRYRSALEKDPIALLFPGDSTLQHAPCPLPGA